MSTRTDAEFVTRRLHCQRLPLAVYREVAAHLRQFDGVQVSLLPQTAEDFDYLQSQVGGIEIGHPAPSRDRVDTVLAYYRDRYGPWQDLS